MDFIALTDGSLFEINIFSDLVNFKYQDQQHSLLLERNRDFTAVVDVCLVEDQLLYLFNNNLMFF